MQGAIFLKSGSIDLYCIKKGADTGASYLYSLAPNEWLFSFEEDSELLFYIQAVEKSQIEVRAWEEADIFAIKTWVEKIASIEEEEDPSLTTLRLTAPTELKKDTGVKISFNLSSLEQSPLYLLKVTSGKIYPDGVNTFILENGSSLLPIPDGLIIHALEDATLEFAPFSKELFGEALKMSYQLFLNTIKHREKEKIAFENLQNQKNQQLEEKAAVDANETLASVLSKKGVTPSFTSIDDPIFSAIQIIGNYLQINIKPLLRQHKFLSTKTHIHEICEKSQIRYRDVILGADDWKKDGGPILVFDQNDTPVVLLPIKSHYYEWIDPKTNTAKPVNAALFSTLKAIGYVFYKPLPEKVKRLAILKFCLEKQSLDFAIILATGILSALFALYFPISMSWVFDKVVPDESYRLLYQICLGLIFISVGGAIFNLCKSISLLRLETRVANKMQSAVMDRLLKLSMSFFNENTAGDIYQRTSAIDQMRQVLSGGALTTILSSLFSFMYLIVMLYRSWTVALITLVPLLLGVIIYTIGLLLTIKKEFTILTMQGKIYSFLVELISGIQKVRIAGAEILAHKKWAGWFSEKKNVELEVIRISIWQNIIQKGTIAIATIVIYFFVTSALKNPKTSHMQVGEFLSFLTAFGSFSTALFSFAHGLTTTLGHTIPLWKRAQPILEAPAEIETQKERIFQLSGAITLESIDFSYQKGGIKIFDNLSLHIKPGEFVAISGSSGCGKSTLIKLLLGFLTPDKGNIYYDHVNLNKLDLVNLRKHIGVVLQTGAILGGSIRDNITCHRDYSDEEIMEVLKIVSMDKDLESLPMGLETILVPGGGTISGGQGQKLMIARALISKPRILIFDEATSALDNISQELIAKNLDDLNVTRIVIAHRLSTIKNADRIYVLQHGKIVETGTFKELIAQSGFFQTLTARQQI